MWIKQELLQKNNRYVLSKFKPEINLTTRLMHFKWALNADRPANICSSITHCSIAIIRFRSLTSSYNFPPCIFHQATQYPSVISNITYFNRLKCLHGFRLSFVLNTISAGGSHCWIGKTLSICIDIYKHFLCWHMDLSKSTICVANDNVDDDPVRCSCSSVVAFHKHTQSIYTYKWIYLLRLIGTSDMCTRAIRDCYRTNALLTFSKNHHRTIRHTHVHTKWGETYLTYR